jgi:hypothetical protein
MRKFLVVLDDSRECLNAMRFAALRAAHTGGGVTILSIVPPEEFQTWMGVADLMRAEARERIEAHFEVFAKWMRDKQGVNPELVIREGDPVNEILAQVKEDRRSASSSWVRAPKNPAPVRWSRRCPAARAACRSRSPSFRATCRRNGWKASPDRGPRGALPMASGRSPPEVVCVKRALTEYFPVPPSN